MEILRKAFERSEMDVIGGEKLANQWAVQFLGWGLIKAWYSAVASWRDLAISSGEGWPWRAGASSVKKR